MHEFCRVSYIKYQIGYIITCRVTFKLRNNQIKWQLRVIDMHNLEEAN